jgi:adenylate cyclase
VPTLAADAALLPELSVRAAGGASIETARAIVAAKRLHVALPALAEAAGDGGHINFLPDPDGIYRRVPLAVRVADRLAPSLAVELLRRHLGGVPATVTLAPDGVAAIRLGERALPVDAAGQLWVNYLGPPRTFQHLPAADVLAGRVPREAIAGKIVLVGFTAAGFDEIATPFAPVAPGVELQATVIDNMLHGRSLRRPWWVVPAEAALVVVIGLLVGLVLRGLRGLGGVVAAAVLALLYAWGSQHLFTRAGLVLGAVYPLGAIVLSTLGGAAWQAVTEEREKRRIREAFRHYLNPEVTEMLAQDPGRLRLGGERCALTIFFSDIRDFTTVSEQLPPEVLGELLNEYLGAMTEIVFRHDGLLDKYIGDAVMAFWGAPVPVPDHAARCCRAALDMVAELETLHARWRTRGLPLLEFRAGINSGQAVVGNFGSSQRFSYTAVGDDVNLASRLEGLNKEYGTRLLVSESTRRAIGDEFVCREVDRVRVKGRAQAVAVHELLGRRADDHDGRLERRASVWEAALAACRREAWDEATTCLSALAEAEPEDRAVTPFLARCQRRFADRTAGAGAGPRAG